MNSILFRWFFDLLATASIAFVAMTGLAKEGGAADRNASASGQTGQQPEARSDALGTFQDTALIVSTSRLLANDTNPNGGTLTVTQVAGGGGANSGTVSLSGSTMTYAPKPGFLGQDMFTYSIADGLGGMAIGSVTVTIGSRSSFKITAIAKSGGQISFSGTAIPGGYYVVQITDTINGAFNDFTGSFQPAPDGTFSFLDLTQPLPAARFYRLRVSN